MKKTINIIIHVILWIWTIILSIVLFDLVVSQGLTTSVFLELTMSKFSSITVLVLIVILLLTNAIFYSYEK